MPELNNNKKEITMFCKKCDKFALVDAGQLHCYSCGNDLTPWS